MFDKPQENKAGAINRLVGVNEEALVWHTRAERDWRTISNTALYCLRDVKGTNLYIMQFQVKIDNYACKSLLNTEQMPQLCQGVSAINTEIRARDVLGSIAKEECYGTHQVLGRPHLSNGDEGGPLITELGILIQDLTGAIIGNEEDISKIILQLHQSPSRQRQKLTEQLTYNLG